MDRLQTLNSVPFEDGQMHMVKLAPHLSFPSWLVHAQIELDGKRVFVRMVDATAITGKPGESAVVGLVVSPVY